MNWEGVGLLAIKGMTYAAVLVTPLVVAYLWLVGVVG